MTALSILSKYYPNFLQKHQTYVIIAINIYLKRWCFSWLSCCSRYPIYVVFYCCQFSILL